MKLSIYPVRLYRGRWVTTTFSEAQAYDLYTPSGRRLHRTQSLAAAKTLQAKAATNLRKPLPGSRWDDKLAGKGEPVARSLSQREYAQAIERMKQG